MSMHSHPLKNTKMCVHGRNCWHKNCQFAHAPCELRAAPPRGMRACCKPTHAAGRATAPPVEPAILRAAASIDIAEAEDAAFDDEFFEWLQDASLHLSRALLDEMRP